MRSYPKRQKSLISVTQGNTTYSPFVHTLARILLLLAVGGHSVKVPVRPRHFAIFPCFVVLQIMGAAIGNVIMWIVNKGLGLPNSSTPANHVRAPPHCPSSASVENRPAEQPASLRPGRLPPTIAASTSPGCCSSGCAATMSKSRPSSRRPSKIDGTHT